LSRYQPGGLLNYIIDYNPATARAGKYVSFGKFGHMKVSGRPEPKSMAAVIENQPGGDGRIRLVQDEVFFHWRFNNIRGKYIFYYLEPAGVLEAYMVIRLSPNSRRGYIIDFAGRAPAAIAGVLRFIVETKPVDILSIYHFSPDSTLLKALFRLGFKRNSLLRMIEKKQPGELPLMIRPLARDYTVRDFYTHGLDTRRIENWQIKEIFSDWV
jgi:hypothetical protein